MSRAVLDQLTLWQEWVRSRLQEVTQEVTRLGAEADRVQLEVASGAPDQVARLTRVVRSLGRLEGQLEQLQEAHDNLEYFVQLESSGSAEGGGDPEDLDFVTQTILHAQEDERYRTSMRIHDGPAQSLANVIMRLEFCEKLSQRDGPKASGEIRDVRRELEEVLQEVRRLIFDLRPMTLDDLGLAATLQRFAENERERLPCDVRMVLRGAYERWSRDAETHIYRVVQEALWNAARHGHPFRVSIFMDIGAEVVRLRVEDDGSGFDATAAATGTGTSEIRRRVRALGGTVRWESAPGEGCKVLVELPLQRLVEA